jgi:hypothetical protein
MIDAGAGSSELLYRSRIASALQQGAFKMSKENQNQSSSQQQDKNKNIAKGDDKKIKTIEPGVSRTKNVK